MSTKKRIDESKLRKASSSALKQLRETLPDDYEVQIIERNPALFDECAQRIPSGTVKGMPLDFEALRIDLKKLKEVIYAKRIGRIVKFLTKGKPFMSVEEFEMRAKAILAMIESDNRIANMNRGIYLPIAFPKMNVTSKTYDRAIETQIMPALEAAYRDRFVDRWFTKNDVGFDDARDTLRSIHSSRQEYFLEAINSGPVVAIFFPRVLRGFSREDAFEQMNDLPERVILAGFMEVAVSIIAYTKEMAEAPFPPYTAVAMHSASWCRFVALRVTFRGCHGQEARDLGLNHHYTKGVEGSIGLVVIG